ncbi:uncharacterized protein [Eurosta solidaginis]|uniref:uncharacterized protein isoform X2 n=1 Tax=Eurosta solidaginis TaxID=178769 RepID=UPI0035313AB8
MPSPSQSAQSLMITNRDSLVPLAQPDHQQASNGTGNTKLSCVQSQYEQASNDKGAAVLSCASSSTKNRLLFRILPVKLYGRQRRIDMYALLDEGSSITMLDDSIAKELDLRCRPHHLSVQWFRGHAVREQANLVDLPISGLGMAKKHKLQNVYAVQNLQLPMQSLSSADLQCEYNQISKLPVKPLIDAVQKMLIGIGNCHLGLASTTIAMKQYGPFAANTELGWVVFRPNGKQSQVPSKCLFVNTNVNRSLHDIVADFFEVESFGVRAAPPIESEADVRARAILEATTRRVGTRFETGLLWQQDKVTLPGHGDKKIGEC